VLQLVGLLREVPAEPMCLLLVVGMWCCFCALFVIVLSLVGAVSVLVVDYDIVVATDDVLQSWHVFVAQARTIAFVVIHDVVFAVPQMHCYIVEQVLWWGRWVIELVMWGQ